MKNNKTKKKRNVLFGRVFDLIIIPIYIVCSGLFLFSVKNYTTKYLLPIAAVLILLLALALVTMFYKNKVIHFIRRFLLIILCACMVIGYTQLSNLDDFFGNLSGDDNEMITVNMNLYALASNDYYTSTIHSYEDLNDTSVAFQKVSDRKNGEKVVEQLKSEFTGIQDYEYATYDQMIEDLQNGILDVAIVNQTEISEIEEKYGSFDKYAILLKTISFETKKNPNANNLDITKEPFTVLVSGTDTVGSPSESSKSDVNILMMVNPNTAQITMISLPRDAYIPNPAYNYENDKLTHTGNDGCDNTATAVAYAFDINVDFYVKVSFSSLIEVVDTLGGIEVDVPIYIEEQDENRSFAADDLIILNPGVQTVNGKQALAFARHRHGYADGDLARNRAQVQIIKAIINKLMTAEGVSKIDDLLEIMPNYILTNFTDSQMKSFIKKEIDNLSSWSINSFSATYAVSDPAGYTASAGAAWICYLDYDEVKKIHAMYELMCKGIDFNEFSFDLTNETLYEDIEYVTPEGVILY